MRSSPIGDLVAELRAAGEIAGIRLVGGAALALRHFEVANADAIPTLGRAVKWETIYDNDGIVIQVASKEAMLAMKLRANRPGRDTRDIRLLLALCDIDTIEQAEALYEAFYPSDLLTERAERMVTAILEGGPTPVPPSPGPIVI